MWRPVELVDVLSKPERFTREHKWVHVESAVPCKVQLADRKFVEIARYLCGKSDKSSRVLAPEGVFLKGTGLCGRGGQLVDSLPVSLPPREQQSLRDSQPFGIRRPSGAGLFQCAAHGTGKIRRVGAWLACFLQNTPHNVRKLLVTDLLDVRNIGAKDVTNLLQRARGWKVAVELFQLVYPF